MFIYLEKSNFCLLPKNVGLTKKLTSTTTTSATATTTTKMWDEPDSFYQQRKDEERQKLIDEEAEIEQEGTPLSHKMRLKWDQLCPIHSTPCIGRHYYLLNDTKSSFISSNSSPN
jgi:hypothetical protein